MGSLSHKTPIWVWGLLLAAAVALPLFLHARDMDFYVSMLSRMMIYGIAACSLNLILGYGGLVSFGHAAFVGIGAYTVGILITEGFTNGWAGFAIAMGLSALAAAVIGAISLRTRGVYFIMITLAFAQMIYYLVNSIKAYGGDEGLNIKQRSDFGLGLDLKNDVTFYFVVLCALVLTLVLISRIMHSRFGRVILAIRDDDVRVDAIGFPSYRYKWVLFVIAGTLGGLAGALMVNHQNYVSPNLMHWTQSATLIVMVIIGGLGRRWGGPVGAAVWLALEEALKLHTSHWHMPLGLLLIATALYAPKGLAALSDLWARSKP